MTNTKNYTKSIHHSDFWACFLITIDAMSATVVQELHKVWRTCNARGIVEVRDRGLVGRPPIPL